MVTVWDSQSKALAYYEHVAFPFGATAAVMSFNWCAVLLRKLAVRLFALLATSYFGDFPTLEAAWLAQSSRDTFESMFALLSGEVSMALS